MRRKALAANSFLLNSRQAPKTDQYIDQYGFSVDGPIWKNKTFFLFNGEKYREGTPAPLNSTTPTAAMRNGDFSRSGGRAGTADRHLRPDDRPRRQRRVDARSVPRQPHPGRPHQHRRRGRSCSTTRTRTTRPQASRRGRATCDCAEHFNKDVFWNWVGKVDHNFGANDRAFFRWGENERNEIRQHATPSAAVPAQDGQLPLYQRQPRARRRLGAHLRRRHGLQPARRLHLLPRVELFPGRARVRFDDVRLAFEPRQPDAKPRRSTASFPRIEIDQFVSLSRGQRARTGTGTTRSSRTCR